MNQFPEESCCFCLSTLRAPFTDIFMQSKNGLTYFGILTSSFTQLANILNENSENDYLLCGKCCESIETTYQFHQDCLRNVGIYLAKRTFKSDYITTEIIIKSEVDEYEIEPEVVSITSDSEEECFPIQTTDLEIKTEPSDLKNEIIQDPLEVMSKIKGDQPHRKSTKKQGSPVKKKFKCQRCSKVFKTKNNLNQHLVIHDDLERFKCETCKKIFFDKSDLDKHIEEYMSEKKRHLHLKLVDNKFKCDVCGKEFNKKPSLTRHRFIHTGAKINCDICNQTFALKEYLNKHKKNKHNLTSDNNEVS